MWVILFTDQSISIEIVSLFALPNFQTVSCDDFLPRTHAHSHTQCSAARTSHAHVRFAKIRIALAHAHVRLCVCVLPKFALALTPWLSYIFGNFSLKIFLWACFGLVALGFIWALFGLVAMRFPNWYWKLRSLLLTGTLAP